MGPVARCGWQKDPLREERESKKAVRYFNGGVVAQHVAVLRSGEATPSVRAVARLDHSVVLGADSGLRGRSQHQKHEPYEVGWEPRFVR